jgi:hypothetical protein
MHRRRAAKPYPEKAGRRPAVLDATEPRLLPTPSARRLLSKPPKARP